MKDMDDADLKHEIDSIMKNVNEIMKKIETMDPVKTGESDNGDDQDQA